MSDLVLESRGISKNFGGVHALSGMGFSLKRGEVHALVGENGAGKSTYIKILSGVYHKDAGTNLYEGREVNFRSTIEARKAGIGMVPQIIELAPMLTVAENIFMGAYPSARGGIVGWKELFRRAEETAAIFGMEALVREPVGSLGAGYRQLVEILKALTYDTKIIAFDEPTAALSEEETRRLFDLIRKLKAKGISIIYVSHRLDELFEIADRITVLKDGAIMGTREMGAVTKDEIVSLMVGRDLNLYGVDERKKAGPGEVALEVKDLEAPGVNGVAFSARKGEILGCFGMVGSGRTETMLAIFGAAPVHAGEIHVAGRRTRIKSPVHAVRLGLGLVPENRISQGVILIAPVKNNITLPFVGKMARKRAGILDLRREQEIAREYIKALKLKTPDEHAQVATLSGGNQQKVSIAKWLATRCDVIIFDEPTHGIDVGAKADIYRLLRELSEEGKAIILVSSELPEILNVCDRILVFRDGRIVKEFAENRGLEEAEVVRYALG